MKKMLILLLLGVLVCSYSDLIMPGRPRPRRPVFPPKVKPNPVPTPQKTYPVPTPPNPLSGENREYTITFMSDFPVEGWKGLSEDRKYNSNNDCFLPTIKTYGYTFAGWEDEYGNLIPNNKIPKNTVAQHIKIKAVWISDRNKFYFEPIKNPTIIEDDQDFKFYYIYPFGRIENIPIQLIRKYGHHNKGETFERTTTKSITFKNQNAQAVSKNIQKKAINSSFVTAIDNWNTTNDNIRNWIIKDENGQNWNITVTNTEEEIYEYYPYCESSHTVTDENSGSSSTSDSSLNRTRNENSSLVQHSDGTYTREHKDIEEARDFTTRGWVANVGEARDFTTRGWGANVRFDKSATVDPDTIEVSHNVHSGFRINGKQNAKTSQTNTITWNYIDSRTNARAVTNSQSIIDRIANTIDDRRSHSSRKKTVSIDNTWNTWNYIDSITNARAVTNSQSIIDRIAITIDDRRSHSSREKTVSIDEASIANGEVLTMTYSESMEVSKSESDKLDIKHAGNYREVVAGTAYIYKIVGYNLKTGQLFTFDHYVLDDKVHTFLDYSYSTDAFNDCESAYDASFTIPAEVFNHIANKVCETKGLVVNSNTGSLDEYEGTSDTVLIPEYSCEPGETEEDGNVVKITSLGSAYVFTANPTIKKVILSDFITEIPDRAFLNCTSLEYVFGGNIQKIGKEAFMNCKSLKSVPVSSITEIGNGAFSGCEALGKVEISSNIKSIGYKAFNEVEKVEATPDNAKIFDAIVYSGAKRISIKTDRLDANSLSGKYIYISNDTEYFYLGQKNKNKQFKNLTINSYAKESVFENIDLKNDACYKSNVWYDGSVNHKLSYTELWFNQRVYPLQLSSKDVKFYNVNIESKGVAILFDHDINLGLFGTSKIKSTHEYSIMSEKFINAYRAGRSRRAVLLTNQKVGIGDNKDIVKLQTLQTLQNFFKKEDNTSVNIVFSVQLK